MIIDSHKGLMTPLPSPYPGFLGIGGRGRVSFIFVVPFLVLLVCRIYSFGEQADTSGADDGIAKMLIEALAYFFAGTFVLLRFADFKPMFSRIWPFFLYTSYALLTAAWSDYPDSVMLRVGHLVGLALVALCAALWVADNKETVFTLLTEFMLIVLMLSVFVVVLFPGRGIDTGQSGEVPVADGRWVGITQHPNLLGAAALVAIWSAFGSFAFSRSRAIRFVSVLSVILALIVLKGTDSRTSQATAVFLVAVYLLLRSKKPISWRTLLTRSVICAVCMGCILALLLAFAPDFLLDHLAPSARYGGGDALSDRPVIWYYGVQALLENPLGWSYDLLATYGDAHGGHELIAHFHNGFLDVAVKGGYLGEILLLVILGRMVVTIRRLHQNEHRLFALYAAFFAANIFYNLAETGFDRESILWPMMIFAWFSVEAILLANIGRNFTASALFRWAQ